MLMDIKQIQELIKFVSKSGVNEVSIEQEAFKITIKTNQQPTYVTASVPVAPAPIQAAVQQPAQQQPAVQQASAPAAENTNYLTIKSPMIGTFYLSASPDKPAFINVGDDVKAGQVVCIVEAMKLFNEIESEISGRVVKVLVDNASPVEYDQPLFLVEPN
ncbi:acetyl-CoA carboxylase biotin carboxyl carrier protein [Pedobacter sp. HMF7647]|uniref:Biotin carboxyl carrier protein of acetyl-CoA carboxylase n=2 Tax=Hufsiella arboris TaxID=2695275 RepID=A0A7K1Y9H4_9SPHI|nr:acetyl-CoA carboxylase biotin carboxyl carrier protein [Hufsiella arboris]